MDDLVWLHVIQRTLQLRGYEQHDKRDPGIKIRRRTYESLKRPLVVS